MQLSMQLQSVTMTVLLVLTLSTAPALLSKLTGSRTDLLTLFLFKRMSTEGGILIRLTII